MKKTVLIIALILLTTMPVSALDIDIPSAPDSAEEYMPADTQSFGEGLWYVVRTAVQKIRPDIADGCKTCVSVIAVALLMALLGNFPGKTKSFVNMAGFLAISLVLLGTSRSLIGIASETIQELSDYGKLLLPVMTASMAAQGGTSGSATLYVGTAFFNSLLGSLISGVLLPGVYVYLAISVANSILDVDLLGKLESLIKGGVTWSLKTILYIFTGYMSITGVVSGATDQAAMKAAKLTISSAVPVVGGILSDASESILVGAGVFKSTAGVYGILAMLSILVGPFLKIGIQYLILKFTAASCSVFMDPKCIKLIHNFSTAMGLLLAMTGSVCLLLTIGTVCFLKGVG